MKYPSRSETCIFRWFGYSHFYQSFTLANKISKLCAYRAWFICFSGNIMAPEQFDDMPKLVLEKDDMESFQRSRGKGVKGNSPTIDTSPQDNKSPSGSSPSWFSLIFLLLLVVGGAAYWSYLQHKVMIVAQSRITELENRLSATGEELDQSAVALQVKVTELSTKTNDLWEQMDKLWASAWRRNQADIKDLSNELRKKSAGLDKKLSSVQTELKGSKASLESLQKGLETQSLSLSNINGSSSQFQQNIADLELQIEGLKERLMSTALSNNNLTNQFDELIRKQKASESELKSIKELLQKSRSAPEPEVF